MRGPRAFARGVASLVAQWSDVNHVADERLIVLLAFLSLLLCWILLRSKL